MHYLPNDPTVMKRILVLLATCLMVFAPGLRSQNVGIGTPSPGGKLHIKGNADVSQLIIDAHGAQSNTSPLIRLRNSLGNDRLWIHSDTALNTFIGIYAGRVNNAVGGGVFNTYTGSHAGYLGTIGNSNSGFGANSLFSNSTGNFNSAHGLNSLFSNASGSWNTAMGANALFANTTGTSNTAVGNTALLSNINGSSNTAIGSDAMNHNTSGPGNTANGFKALFSNTTGEVNTACGSNALFSNTTESANTAVGGNALYNTIAGLNTAVGYDALVATTTGGFNTGVGKSSLGTNTAGFLNTACGLESLYNNTTGSNNTAIGFDADVSAGNLNYAVVFGANATVNASHKVRIGNGSVSVIEGQVAYSWPSDGRFKENIEDDVKGLDFILKLQPVSYNFNRLKFAQHVRENISVEREEILVAQSQQRSVGFVAQDVEKIIQETGFSSFDAVHAPTNETDNYSMGYAVFVVPLVKAVQEQQLMIESQNEKIEFLLMEIELLRQKLK